jgi:competence protein ComEA
MSCGVEEVDHFMPPLLQPRLLAAAGLLLLAAGLLWGAFGHEKPERLPPDWQPVNGRLAATSGDGAGAMNRPDAAGTAAPGGASVPAGTGASDAAPPTGAADSGSSRATGDASSGSAGPDLNRAMADASSGSADSGSSRATADASSGSAGPDLNRATPVPPSASFDINRATSVSSFAGFDINRATEAEWDELPGIGPSKARAIVEDRERNGPFRSIDDLARVKGIGPKLLERLREAIEARNRAGS